MTTTDSTPNDDGQFSLFDSDAHRKFEEFHARNPLVYDVLVRLAREWVARFGRHQLGIAALFERARWEIALATSDPAYKLNNNLRAWYARLLMAQNVDLDGLFELRRSEADDYFPRRAA